jgi:hypothetical protein
LEPDGVDRIELAEFFKWLDANKQAFLYDEKDEGTPGKYHLAQAQHSALFIGGDYEREVVMRSFLWTLRSPDTEALVGFAARKKGLGIVEFLSWQAWTKHIEYVSNRPRLLEIVKSKAFLLNAMNPRKNEAKNAAAGQSSSLGDHKSLGQDDKQLLTDTAEKAALIVADPNRKNYFCKQLEEFREKWKTETTAAPNNPPLGTIWPRSAVPSHFPQYDGDIRHVLVLSAYALLAVIHDNVLPNRPAIAKGILPEEIVSRIWHDLVTSASRAATMIPDATRESRRASFIATMLRTVKADMDNHFAEATQQVSAGQSPAALELDEPRSRIRVEGIWHDITDEAKCMLSVLFHAKGAWVQGSTIGKRPDKTRNRMPAAVKAVIETHRTSGYRIPSLLPK